MTTDDLRNVKAHFVAVALAGFGARHYLPLDRQPPDVKLLHNHLLPALHDAIRHHDPVWDADAEIRAGHWVIGGPQESLTAADGTGAVRWHVELLEYHRAMHGLIDSGGDLYARLYEPSVASGCYLDDLAAALRADDPSWRS